MAKKVKKRNATKEQVDSMMEKIKPYLKPKTVVFYKGDGLIERAIIKAQNIYWKALGKESEWHHIGFIGTDGKHYESTVKLKVIKKPFIFGIKIPTLKFVYGIYVSDIEKQIKKKIKNVDKARSLDVIGFQYNFNKLSDEDWQKITDKGKELYKEKYKYGGEELFGTLIRLVQWRFAKTEERRDEIMSETTINHFEGKKKGKKDNEVYCIAFVDVCMSASNKGKSKAKQINYCDIHQSITTVDHGWNTSEKCTKKKIEIDY